MPAWPGGPCPQCGEDMPANLVHCRNCRQLLNEELARESVEIPVFIPLPEIDSVVPLTIEGYYVPCPHCEHELKISRKYVGERVQCKFCDGGFRLDLDDPHFRKHDGYAPCPHCTQPLRFASKYFGANVACRFCNGKIHIDE